MHGKSRLNAMHFDDLFIGITKHELNFFVSFSINILLSHTQKYNVLEQ